MSRTFIPTLANLPSRSVSEASETDIETSSSPGSTGQGGGALSRAVTPAPGGSVPFKMPGEPTPTSRPGAPTESSDFLTMDDMLASLTPRDLKPHTLPEPAARASATKKDLGTRQPKPDTPRLAAAVNFFSSSNASAERPKSPGTGPQTGRTTEWDDLAATHPQGPHDLMNAARISQRAALLDQLLLALHDGQFTQVNALLASVPAEVEHLDRYFPPAPSGREYNALLRRAEQLDEKTPTASSRRLLAFIGDCKLRSTTQQQMVKHQQRLDAAQLNKIYPPSVRALCEALRDASDKDLHASPSPFLKLVKGAMANENLMAKLATQPYANLRMLEIKCTVLAAQIDPKLASILLEEIREARAFQKEGSARLRQQLLQHPVVHKNVAAFALMEYAKQMTSLPLDYVSAGATRDEVLVMKRALQDTFEHYVAVDSGHLAVELVALQWVMDQIIKTQQLAD